MKFKRVIINEQLDWLHQYARVNYKNFRPSSPQDAYKFYLILANKLNIGYCIPYNN